MIRFPGDGASREKREILFFWWGFRPICAIIAHNGRAEVYFPSPFPAAPPTPACLLCDYLGKCDAQDARGFIRAVIQHRALAPAARSLDGLMAARRWHPHFGGYTIII